jgi:hypothetical protein
VNSRSNKAVLALRGAVIRAKKRSGTTTQGREELRTVLDFLRKGDVLIVTRIDRLVPSIGDLLRHRAGDQGQGCEPGGDRTTDRHPHRGRQMLSQRLQPPAGFLPFGGFGSVPRSIPLGLMLRRPGPPLSRAISSGRAATVLRSSDTSANSFSTESFSLAGDRHQDRSAAACPQ